MAAASDSGALHAAQALARKKAGPALTFATARPVLVRNLCEAITQNDKRHKEAQLVCSIVQRFFNELPLRLLVILLGRILPLLRSTATPGTPLLQAFGKPAGRKAGQARIMHTMARIVPSEHTLWCTALSADFCGLRHFQLVFYPPITSLAHFHPLRKPPRTVGLMVTQNFHLGPSFSWRSPSLRHTTKGLSTGAAWWTSLAR